MSSRQNRLRKKNPDVTHLFKKAKITELRNNIPDVSSFVTKLH